MMKKFSSSVPLALKSFGKNSDVDLLARRTAEVQQMWSGVVAIMWPDPEATQMILQHTNMVGISQEDGYQKLFVYVDDSIVLSELNALRERIKLLFLSKFGEDIEVFEIKIAQGQRKKTRPYAKEAPPTYIDKKPSIPLTVSEIADVRRRVSNIENPQLKESLSKAMISDLEWKKGLNEKKPKND